MKLGRTSLQMTRKKVLKEVSPKKDLKQRTVSFDTPLKWIELSRELLKLGCPPEDLQRVKGSKWEVVFTTEEQAQEVGGSSWHVGLYVLLPHYLEERKASVAPTAPVATPKELKEKADKKAWKEYLQGRRLQSLEGSINELRDLMASLIKVVKVSNEHKFSSGALPLMQKDTTPTKEHVEKRDELGMGWLQGPTPLTPLPVQTNSSTSVPNTSWFNPPTGAGKFGGAGVLAQGPAVVKYPTNMGITPALGQQPLMSQDTPERRNTTKEATKEDMDMREQPVSQAPTQGMQEKKDTREAMRTDAEDKAMRDGEVTEEDEAMAAYMAARAGYEATKKVAQQEEEAKQRAARDAAHKASQEEAQKAAQEAAKEKERIAVRELERKAEEDKIMQEKKAAEKILEAEARERKEWLNKLDRLQQARNKSAINTTTTTSSTHTPTPTQQIPDYTEDESGTIVYAKGKGDKRWHQAGFCVRCKREVRLGEVRFFNKHQQIHTRCGTCPTCKESLAEADLEMGALRVWCGCGRAVDFFHQC